jgi:hypothetical protein
LGIIQKPCPLKYRSLYQILLRSDLEVLEKDGRINLEELGLLPEEDPNEQSGQIFVNALKNVSARFRRESQNQTDDKKAYKVAS